MHERKTNRDMNPNYCTPAQQRKALAFSQFYNPFGHFAPNAARPWAQEPTFVPYVDILENGTEFQLQVAAPGLKKEDFDLKLDNNRLTISGERKGIDNTDGTTVHRSETPYGKFSRTFILPKNVDKTAISARYENGILHVGLPKSTEAIAATHIAVN